MKVAIVYDTNSGTTAGAAEAMAKVVEAAGHKCVVENVSNADPKRVATAGAIVLGCWTKGYYVIKQHPSEPALTFIESLSLNGKPTAVFATYKLAVGSTLRQMANVAESAGGKVTGMYKVKGAKVPAGFEEWVASLGTGAAI
jgi:flavodoxin